MLSKDGICYKICNSSTIEISTEKYVEPIIHNSEINELLIGNESLKLKQVFKFPIGNRIVPYEINHILRINDNKYLLKTELRNKTTQYLLPILEKLKLNKTTVKQLDKDTLEDISRYCNYSYLINAYLGGEETNRLDGYLYLKMRFSPHEIYQIMEEAIVDTHPLFVKVIDLKDEYTYYKFKIPNEFKEDIYLFLEGKYSKFSSVLKNRITMFHSLKPESNLFQIITGGNSYREKLSKSLGYSIEGELDSIPEITNELIMI